MHCALNPEDNLAFEATGPRVGVGVSGAEPALLLVSSHVQKLVEADEMKEDRERDDENGRDEDENRQLRLLSRL